MKIQTQTPRWGFTRDVATMDLSGPHTVRNPEQYLTENLGADTLEWVRSGSKAVVAVGEGKNKLAELAADGWTFGEPVDKAVGFHQVRRAVTPDGQDVMLVWRVNGEDRIDHVQSLLALAGAESEQVGTVGETRRYKDDYLKTFQKLGDPPDLVVYGMAKTAASAVLSAHPLRNLKELWNVFQRRGAPLVGETEATSDMSGMRMEIMQLRNGQKIWFLPPLYGDLSHDLLQALLEHGVKKLNFVGTAGGVDPSLQVGQVLSPTHRLREDGVKEPLDWLIPTEGKDAGGVYQRVDTPNRETQAWAQEKHAAGVDLIEVELDYWLEETRKRPDVELRVQTVLSDVVQGPNHRDMTEWGFWDNLGLSCPILKSIREALGQPGDLRIEEYKAVPLV